MGTYREPQAVVSVRVDLADYRAIAGLAEKRGAKTLSPVIRDLLAAGLDVVGQEAEGAGDD